jgi:hypothetical protein
MKPELQRIAIAEACGWVFRDGGNFAGVAQKLVEPPHGRLTHIMTHKAAIRSTPDYLNDLNAMHEAEKTLDYNDLNDMEESVSFHFGVTPFHATASQRAEAFLRTVGKWEES